MRTTDSELKKRSVTRLPHEYWFYKLVIVGKLPNFVVDEQGGDEHELV
jgi:hypothetical protein